MGLNAARSTPAGSLEGRFTDRQGAMQAGRLRPYRCPGCGQEVAFDSLAASCRCSDECYAETMRGADEPPGLHA